jgi:hypothetical protein
MSIFRETVNQAVRTAAASGQSYSSILADLSTVLGCMIAASSEETPARLARVKASMAVVAEVLNRPEPPERRTH